MDTKPDSVLVDNIAARRLLFQYKWTIRLRTALFARFDPDPDSVQFLLSDNYDFNVLLRVRIPY